MTADEPLARGRESFARRAWDESYRLLSAADRRAPLDGPDLEKLAEAAYLTGREAECDDLLARSHHAALACGDRERAARSAFWLAFALFNRGEPARGGGWIALARRALGDGPECVVHGYLRLPDGEQRVMAGDLEGADAVFRQALDSGRRFGDANLIAMALHGRGRALIRMGRAADGVALLDEAMAAVTADEVSALTAGDVYCGVIEACHEIFDLRRAHEWTQALDRWCVSQPDLVRFRGECLVRRAEILQVHGAWPDAIDQAQRACERLADPPQRAIGAAYYQWAEILRLHGELARAEEMYRQAGQSHRSPQPGLSLLRLAQGHVDVAATGIRTALDGATEPRTRSRLLPAYVEIMIASGDPAGARAGAAELNAIAARLDAPFLRAASDFAQGATLLADGDARRALVVLRDAAEVWAQIEAPYEVARTRLLIGRACRALGDRDTAAIEDAAARHTFKRLGATSDLARLEAASTPAQRAAASGLSARELDVLRHLVTGKTNRAIADELCISEKTVARHVSNIFNKLGLSTRAAATAYAYQHHLV